MNLQPGANSFGAAIGRESTSTVAIIGGGPAGLTAAYELHKHSSSHHPVVFEESGQVGGISRTEVYKGRQVTTYWVRWRVGGRLWKEAFRTVAQADSFRSALLTAARKGEAFSMATGRPTAWEREKAQTTWYEFACTYTDMKWKQASAKYRKDRKSVV